MPTQRDWPRPTSVVCATASYVKVPERETIPAETVDKSYFMSASLSTNQHTDLPGFVNVAGLDAHLATQWVDDTRAVRPHKS